MLQSSVSQQKITANFHTFLCAFAFHQMRLQSEKFQMARLGSKSDLEPSVHGGGGIVIQSVKKLKFCQQKHNLKTTGEKKHTRGAVVFFQHKLYFIKKRSCLSI